MLSLDDLGSRICIMGPSNSGKSTLANRIAAKINAPVFHLDQMAHKPNTHWERKPDVEFITEHDIALNKDSWVMDGNYSVCMPQRFERATSVIWIDPPLIGFLWRYVLRSILNKKDREGSLSGALSEFSFALIKYTFFNYPKNKLKYTKMLNAHKFPVIMINSITELNKYYNYWEIKR